MYDPNSKERYVCAPVKENTSGWVPEGKNGYIRLEGTSMQFDVPLDPNGDGKTPLKVLTKEDEKVLTEIMGLPANSLSVYLEKNNRWIGKNRFKADIGNEEKVFDMSDPYHYVQVQILKANVGMIASSYPSRLDAKYYFYLDKQSKVDEEANSKFTLKMKGMQILAELKDNRAKMESALLVLYKSDRQVIGRDISDSRMQRMLYENLEKNPGKFYEVLKDSNYENLVYFYRGLDKGAIMRNGMEYRLANTNKIIGNTTGEVVEYINNLMHNAEKQAEWETFKNSLKTK